MHFLYQQPDDAMCTLAKLCILVNYSSGFDETISIKVLLADRLEKAFCGSSLELSGSRTQFQETKPKEYFTMRHFWDKCTVFESSDGGSGRRSFSKEAHCT